MQRRTIVAATCAAALAAGALAAGCGRDSCDSGDLACFLDHLLLFQEKEEGAPIGVVTVDTSAIPATATAGHPEITNRPAGAEYDGPSTLMPLVLDWTDASCGQTPSFCLTLCSPEGGCTSKSACTHSIGDGVSAGTWRASLGYLAEPDSVRERFFLKITPVCAQGSQDAAKAVKAGAGIFAGPSVLTEQIIDSPDDPTGASLPPVPGTGGAGGLGGAGGAAGAGGSGG